MPRIIDLLGKRFGRLTVTKLLPERSKNFSCRWLCICDCGNEKIVTTQHLQHKDTKSCGCQYVHQTRKYMSPGEAGARHLYRAYQAQAKRRKLSFDLSFETFRELTALPCVYCGLPPHNIMGTPTSKTHYSDYCYNGIDRIDSARGYEMDNVDPCCTTCNTMKWRLSKKDFLIHLSKILEHQQRSSRAVLLP